MYTQQDLIDAMQAGDFALVATIGEYFKGMADSAAAAKYAMENTPKKPIKPIPGPKAVQSKSKAASKAKKNNTIKPTKKTKKEDPLPAPKAEQVENATPWIVSSQVSTKRDYGRVEDDVRLDGRKPKILTSDVQVDMSRASPELRRAEKAKTKARNPAVNRQQAEKIQWPCDGCGRMCEIFPSRLDTTFEDDGSENPRPKQFYKCEKCVQKPKRSR